MESIEFNGSMYPSGYGDATFEGLHALVSDEQEFINFIEFFNKATKDYPDQLIYEFSYQEIQDHFDFSKGYYKNRFSDWLFIKNLSGRTIHFKTTEDQLQDLEIRHGQTVKFHFGILEKAEHIKG